jgi:quinol monooxygenase YgiN
MSDPVVFVSHFAVKEGKIDELRRLADEFGTALRSDKPATAAYLMYLDDEGTRLTIVHTFPDADAMDLHFLGADERSAAAYELIEPRGWEIYGSPNDQSLDTMRREAAAAGVPLTVLPAYLSGFLRFGED